MCVHTCVSVCVSSSCPGVCEQLKCVHTCSGVCGGVCTPVKVCEQLLPGVCEQFRCVHTCLALYVWVSLCVHTCPGRCVCNCLCTCPCVCVCAHLSRCVSTSCTCCVPCHEQPGTFPAHTRVQHPAPPHLCVCNTPTPVRGRWGRAPGSAAVSRGRVRPCHTGVCGRVTRACPGPRSSTHLCPAHTPPGLRHRSDTRPRPPADRPCSGGTPGGGVSVGLGTPKLPSPP